MILVKLTGGLGNQMFQYAFGKALAARNNTRLVLDAHYLESKLPFKKWASQMKYELGIFNPDLQVEHSYFSPGWMYPFAKLEYIFSDRLKKKKYKFLKETDFSFQPSYLEAADNTYVEGNFQSDKYFKSIASQIKMDFDFKPVLDAKNLAVKSAIEHSNAVSLHIRRGDYLNLKQNRNKFANLPLSYYHQAILYISSHVPDPVFFIFSDDMPWVKENLRIDFPSHFIDNNIAPGTSYFDMQLMSLCKHNIISNSTFSWWGAWLNNFKEKIVIAPSVWFTDPSINSKDIYPSEWIKL